MVRILPDRLGNDEFHRRIDPGKNLHALFLRADEAVFFFFLVGVRSYEFKARGRHTAGQGFFDFILGRPTVLVGRKSQIAIGYQQLPAFLRRCRKATVRGSIFYHR